MLESLIEKHLSQTVIDKTFIGTGVFQAYQVTLENTQSIFIKYQTVPSQQLIIEAKMLTMLGNTIQTPKVLASCEHCLILEWINEYQIENTQIQVGKSLAALHRVTQDYFGFNTNNHIGSTDQLNAPSKHLSNWSDFYWQYRLLFQIELANNNNYLNQKDYRNLLGLKSLLPKLLDHDIKPALLHGDLWSGNLISSKTGPYFIDPACYFGHREIDFSLTFMFGGFSNEFYTAYNADFPLEQGFEKRKPLYMLYHYLNHLNIFGGSGYHANIMNCYNALHG